MRFPVGRERSLIHRLRSIVIPPICFCRGQALFVSGLSCYDEIKTLYSTYWGFNALSGLSCYLKHTHLTSLRQAFQCPHGLELLRLEPIQRAYSKASFNALSGLSCYCDIYVCIWHKKCFNALSGLYLISTVPLQKPRFYAVSRACFCRYLSEYSDNSSFSCMLTFWTYLMRCTYP